MSTATIARRLLVLSLLGYLAATAAHAEDFRASVNPDGTLRVDAAQRASAATVSVADHGLDGFLLRARLDGVTLTPRDTSGGPFVDVSWENAERGGAIGSAELPVIRRLFAAPPDAQLELRIRSAAPQVVDSALLGVRLRVTPRQAPVPKIPGALAAAAFELNAAEYARDADNPEVHAVIEEAGILAGQRLLLLEVRPVSCNPVAETLTFYPELEAEVRFAGYDVAAGLPVAPAAVRDVVVNPDAVPVVLTAGGRYLILVASAYQSGIAAFAAAKQAQGYVVTTQTVAPGTSNTAIRSMISSWYAGAGFDHYVLLVGDTDTIPHFTGGGDGSPATDLPYGCMDGGDDWMPEIAVGRFSVRSAAQLTAIVNKTLTYENGPLVDPDYLKRAVFMASTDNYQVSEGTHNYVINNYMDPNGYVSDKLYTVTYDATTQNVRDSFNDGRFYGVYSGHGGTYSWADGPPFEQSDVNALQNAGMYPFVLSFACITGTYTVDECFTETWSRAAGKGAVAIYGSSVNSYWTEDDVLEKRLFDSIFDDTDDVPSEVGPVWNDTRVRYLAQMGSSGTTRRYFEMYNLLGDPSLRFPGSCTDAGMLTLDRPKYACAATVTVTLNDCGLNTSDSAVETVLLDIESDSESGVEQVTLVETDAASAEFVGSITISTADAPGVLLVAADDMISVKYIDADNGAGGYDVVVLATAVVDCTPPVISNIHATDVEPRSAAVHFDGNEPVRGTVHYGLTCPALNQTAAGSAYATSAVVNLSGLTDNTTYCYAVTAEDEAGNPVSDDNGGACYVFTTPEVPDYFTELFDSNDNDLDYLSLTFTPNGSNDYYAACAEAIIELPTDPAGGTALSLGDDEYTALTLSGGATVSLYGQAYSTIYLAANGFLTFGQGDGAYTESFAAHFDGPPRISALFDDLRPGTGSTVSWKQLPDRVAMTWLNVPEYSSASPNTFQIVMYFDGTIEINYLAIAATDGLAGLSAGEGVDPDFFETDLSALGACGPRPPVASAANLVTPANHSLGITLNAIDDGLPDPPAALAYRVTNLPTHGTLIDPQAGAITSVPYTLVGGGNQATYQPDFNYYGPDGFSFQADDGGTSPEGGISNVALVSILVQARPPVTSNLHVEVPQDTMQPITMSGSDPDGDVLTYVITTLPAHGILVDPQAGPIAATPHALAAGLRVVQYTPEAGYLGDDAFAYHAEDGIFSSADSTVTLFVKAPAPQITTQYLASAYLLEPYSFQFQVSGGQPPLVWSLVTEPVYEETDLGSCMFAETGVAMGWQRDDAFWWYDLPFAFPFYGAQYTSIRVWSNGFIDFGAHTGSAYANSDALLIANRQIAPLWDDLKTTGEGDDIFIDASIAGALTIRWEATHYSSPTAEIKVALTLFEDGGIRFDYGPGNNPLTPTVGVSNGDGTHYTLSAYNGAAQLDSANSVRLRIPQGLPEGITLDADGLLSGTPVEAISSTFTVQVMDSLERSDVKAFSIDVAALIGDWDSDGDVDLVDFAALQRCFTGEDLGPVPAGCSVFDVNHDGDVDCADFAAFYLSFGY